MSVLPIESLRGAFLAALAEGPVVVSAPTGSGKSTAVPRFCEGRVLVIEPRRVACQSLARWVAELEGVALGAEVGFHVRDSRRAGPDTRILFMTPGIALRTLDAVAEYDVVILDELHERGLETDLLLALLRERVPRLVAMSATLEADRVAAYLGGVHVTAEGRTFDVEVRHRAGDVLLPDARGVTERVLGALEDARKDPGDVLVFLPGKGEIAAVRDAIERGPDHVVELHGGLSLDRQAKAFARAPAGRRKVVLATNVAETSLTIDGVGVVIDSGLVRRTRFHKDRGYLSLAPIAMDSAEQRAGRAGRTGPGVCIRLWSPAARLEAITPPAVHRESLTPLVLSAAAAGVDATTLEFLDAPKDYALDAARDELTALGAIDERFQITERGRAMFGLPLDAPHARLLVEAKLRGCLDDAIDLVAAIGQSRPLFVGPRPTHAEDDLRAGDCDAVAAIRAVRIGDARTHGLSSYALKEARSTARRLRKAFDLEDASLGDPPIDRRRLLETAVAADPRSVHVARSRKRKVAWSNGGTEIELARESAVAAAQERGEVQAIAVLESRAFGLGLRDTKVLATVAMPVPLGSLAALGLGRDRLASVEAKKGRIVARIERVYAKKVIGEREEVPAGALAREAIRDLIVRGSLFRGVRKISETRVTEARLAKGLGLVDDEPAPYGEWLLAQLGELGVESGADLPLLSAEDVTFPDVPYEVRHVLEQEYPMVVALGDATYRAEYDVQKRRVTLHMTKGTRSKPPPRSWLPRFGGFRIVIEAGGTFHQVR